MEGISIFEMIMMIGFWCAWPVAIHKTYTSRSNDGKSLSFLIIIFLAYIAGIIHKMLYSPDVVLLLYILNALMVIIDGYFYFRNEQIAKNKKQ
jgi:hypothetical protein